MPFDNDEAPRLAEILRKLRALSIAGEEAGAITLVRSLSRDIVVRIINAVGMDRWDEERGIVPRTAKQWQKMPEWSKRLCSILPMRVHGILLLIAEPLVYKEPRLPNRAAKARASEEVAGTSDEDVKKGKPRTIGTYERRRARHQSLWHPEDDIELLDREKRFVGTIHDHEAGPRRRTVRQSHRVHLDRLSRPDSSAEAG